MKVIFIGGDSDGTMLELEDVENTRRIWRTVKVRPKAYDYEASIPIGVRPTTHQEYRVETLRIGGEDIKLAILDRINTLDALQRLITHYKPE